MPRTEEWLLGFGSAATLLEEFSLGLIVKDAPLYPRATLRECIVTVNNPLIEVILLGTVLTGIYRGIRGILISIRSRRVIAILW